MAGYLAVALGGALGALLRYAAARWMASMVASDFPFATFGVNILGSLLMGAFFALWADRLGADDPLRLLITVGFLGSLTTFSTFSMEAAQLIERGALGLAGAYALLSVFLGVGSFFVGLFVVRGMT